MNKQVSKLPHGPFWQRLPFAILMVVFLVAFGVTTESHAGPLAAAFRRAFGSSLQTTIDGDFVRLFTSLFLTAGGWRFFASALMLGLGVGWAERLAGTIRAITVFLSVHIITLMIIYFGLILPSAASHFANAEWLVDARDVGPSAGYYGCLGSELGRLNSKWRWTIVAVISLVLLARLIISSGAIHEHPHQVIGDVAHVIAFPLGLALAAVRIDPFVRPEEAQTTEIA